MNSVNKKYNERLKRFQKAIRLEVPDRVPIFSLNSPEVTVEYAGEDLKTVHLDFIKLRKTIPQYYEDLLIDGVATAFLRNSRLYTHLGAKNFNLNKDGFMQYSEVQGMLETDYEELITMPMETIVKKILPRIYTAFSMNDPASSLNIGRGFTEYIENSRQLREIDQHCVEVSGIPVITNHMVEAPFDFLADQLRGLTGIVTDMHRRPEQVETACEALLPLLIKWGMSGFKETGAEFPGLFIPLHMPPFLNPSQFERFFWPTFKRMVDEFTGSGHTVSLFLEGDWTNFYDFLQSFDRRVIGFFETGDLKIIKNKLGKSICIAGNYPISVLNSEPLENCIDIAKAMLDVAAPGGGYIFSTGKVVLRKKGIDLEKLKAVHRYVIENSKY
ncbi:uroporphyrinogen decarboxylase family protein [Eubacteriaceae bacterium ES3]|nr:uroporphyrinogen decarboxylase family protein [Eubacteriaceae bacterium ES3]